MVWSEDVGQENGGVDYYCHHNAQLTGDIGKMGCKILILLQIITILLRHFPFK
jgi:hypothetical protein